MDFKEATDALTAGTALTLGEVAAEFGVTLNSLSRMRGGHGANRLQPPKDWSAVLARLAHQQAAVIRGRASALEQLAAELEREVPAPCSR